MMTWEGTSNATRLGGWEVEELVMTEKLQQSQRKDIEDTLLCAFIPSLFETTIRSELES